MVFASFGGSRNLGFLDATIARRRARASLPSSNALAADTAIIRDSSTRRSSIAANIAINARENIVPTAPTTAALRCAVRRRWRCHKPSNGMSNNPATRRTMTFRKGSFRTSIPNGWIAPSLAPSPSSNFLSRAGGKHSSPWPNASARPDAFGSPDTMTAKIWDALPRSWKYLISSLTQRDRTALGEQMTIKFSELSKARLMEAPRLASAANSSSSRKICPNPRLYGTTPAAATHLGRR